MLIEGLGAMVSSQTYAGRKKQEFISADRIEALIINEGITFHSVVFYMAIMLKGKNEMILLFDVCLTSSARRCAF